MRSKPETSRDLFVIMFRFWDSDEGKLSARRIEQGYTEKASNAKYLSLGVCHIVCINHTFEFISLIDGTSKQQHQSYRNPGHTRFPHL